MNEIKEFIEILEGQKENLTIFIDIAKSKQKALLENDRELFDKIIKEEEFYISKLTRSEKEKRRALKEIFGRNLTEEERKLNNLVKLLSQYAPEEESKQIESLQLTLRDLAEELSTINNQNMFLIRNARQFLIDTINTLMNEKRASIFDRKV
jgi:dsDNA-binding SOS-regulon protein